MRYETEPLRPSIFDSLKERHPDRSRSADTRRPPSLPHRRRPQMLRPVGRSPRSTAGLVAAIVLLFACGGLGLVSLYRPPAGPDAEAPPEPVFASAAIEPESAPAEPRLGAALTQAVEEVSGVKLPFDLTEDVREVAEELAASLEPAALPRPPTFEDPRPEPEDRPAPVPEDPEPRPEPEAAEVAESAPQEAVAADRPAAEVRPAVKIFSAKPDYPEAARQAGLAGTVIVEAEIDTEGSVASTRVLRSVSPELDQAAREAVGRWRFEPATSSGEPVADVYRAAIHFELEPPAEPETEVAARPAADDFEPPLKLYAPPPSYPPSDWVAAVEGDVVVQAAISETGQVTGVEILQGLTAGLNQAAVEALKRWRFRPATRQGKAVASDQVLTFRFAR